MARRRAATNSPAEQRAPSWATGAIFSALVALACVVVHLFVTSDATNDLQRQMQKRTILRQEHQRQQSEATRLQVLDDALETDPQTIERGLRLAGMGRKGDKVVHVVGHEQR